MALTYEVYVVCSHPHCEEEELIYLGWVKPPSARKMLTKAKESGWMVKGTRTFCPKCVKNDPSYIDLF